MMTKKSPKVAKNFYCEKCDYECCKQSDWNKHALTAKHIKDDAELQKNRQNRQHFVCECGNKYKYRQGLWNHKKNCLNDKNENIQEDNEKNVILTLIQQNNELQKQMLEVIKSGTNINSTVNNNSHNKTFNLQLYLNETCKDAMNIMDFVDSIKFQLSDLESVGELGYIKGISNIIIRNLKALDENMRPVHCSDLRREKIYVKDADTWTKEGADNKILKNAIKYIAHKNVKMIPAFREKYPDCIYSDSRKSDQYNRLIIEAMGGDGNDEDGKANKIISKIAKEVLIEK
jgi:hypothetical protein